MLSSLAMASSSAASNESAGRAAVLDPRPGSRTGQEVADGGEVAPQPGVAQFDVHLLQPTFISESGVH